MSSSSSKQTLAGIVESVSSDLPPNPSVFHRRTFSGNVFSDSLHQRLTDLEGSFNGMSSVVDDLVHRVDAVDRLVHVVNKKVDTVARFAPTIASMSAKINILFDDFAINKQDISESRQMTVGGESLPEEDKEENAVIRSLFKNMVDSGAFGPGAFQSSMYGGFTPQRYMPSPGRVTICPITSDGQSFSSQATTLHQTDAESSLQSGAETSSVETPRGHKRSGRVLIGGHKDNVRRGLRNDDKMSSVNAVIQACMHVPRFKNMMKDTVPVFTSEHIHNADADNCVVCFFYGSCQNLILEDTQEAASLVKLALALNRHDPERFPLHKEWNPVDVFEAIVDCIHNSEEVCDLRFGKCFGHRTFGMIVEQKIRCTNCVNMTMDVTVDRLVNRVSAASLLYLKDEFPEKTFEQNLHQRLLLEEDNCAHCHQENSYHLIPKTPLPSIFTSVITWKYETVDESNSIVGRISTTINLKNIFGGYPVAVNYVLISMVCYSPKEEYCCCFGQQEMQWVVYCDEVVEEIGGWAEVVAWCKEYGLRPVMLIYKVASSIIN